MKSYFITGTAKGIGLGLVEQALHQENTQVFAVVRETSDLTELNKLKSPRLHIITADITNLDQVDAAVDKVSTLTDGIDVAILNAAYLAFDAKALPEISLSRENYKEYAAQSEQFMDINVNCQLYLAQKLVPLLKGGEEKKLTFISSSMSDVDLTIKAEAAYALSYSMSKAALNVLAAKLAVALKPEGISVFSICPGLVNSAKLPQEKIEETYGPIVQKLARVYPDMKEPLSVEESSSSVIKTIDFFDIRASGRFFSHNGTTTIT